jgi:hypothetical protein
MNPITAEQQAALAAAGWTEADAQGFAQALVSFRESLPPRQQEGFTAILAVAAEQVTGDMQGYGDLFLGGMGIVAGAVLDHFGSTAKGIKQGVANAQQHPE